MDGKEILKKCAEPIPWDDEEQEEHFYWQLENRPEEAWEQIAYYWWADYMAPAEWWGQMAEVAIQMGREWERKLEYASMRVCLIQNANDAKMASYQPMGLGKQRGERQELKIYLFASEPPSETGMYMVWMENEYKGEWGNRMWIGQEHDHGEPVSDQAPSVVFNGTWSTQAYDAPILYWAKLPDPPKGHFRKSEGIPQ
jgi:hypothetical protein